ncbi:hypothetical protein BBJ28_00020000 [Nothophytophthora sp. Chile5]|nr:hypothetical protein BBJ28_00020000 [Nothophytophthora sp. Chile5]
MGIFAQLWEVYKERGSEVMVHRTVNAKLGSDGDAPAVAAFVREAEVFLADEDMLLLMLSVGLDGLYETQFSFVGVLLREEVLQPKLVDILLEKFSASMDAQLMEKNVPKLILRELRWMDLVVDSRQLIAKLIGALPAFSASLQRDIIYILPELASDEDSVVRLQLLVVNTLLELIRSEAALVTCCIEALGNFNVLTDQTSAVVECVLERLDSSPLADLPAIVKYLVQETPMTDVEQIVDQLREQLSTTLAFQDSAATASQASSNDEALILGSIIQGFYFREELARIFAARIQTVERLKLLDLWILFGATSIPQHQTRMEKLFLRKTQAGLINTDLLVRGIAAHGNALKAYFPSILSLAGKLLMQSSDVSCVQMGSMLFELLFEEFSVGSTDASSSTRIAYYQGEVRALSCLCGSSCFAFVVPQVRKMYDVLFAVGGHEDSDLCNILLKQAFHQETRYRCFGILGAVSRLGRLLQFFRETTAPTARGGADGSETGREPLKTTLKTSAAKEFTVCMTELHRSYLSDTKCFGFMLEELTDFIGNLELDELGLVLVSNIFNYYLEFFQTRFMEDFDVAHSAQYSKTVMSGAMKSELWLNIDAKNLSRLETILLDEVLPFCPAFAVPRLSGGGIDQHQSFGKTKSLFDPTERKKPGRPPKVSATVDRATLVKKSFLPLKSEVISILAFPRVLDSVIRGGSSDRLETAGGERSNGFALKTVRIELLFSLFRYHMDWCSGEEKPKSSFSWGTVAHTSGRKENVLAHDVASKSSSRLLAELSTAGVLNAAEKYACHFLAVIKEHGEDESASEDEETKEGDQPAPSTSLVKRILCEYLEIMVLFLNHERGASKNDPAADVIHVQQLQSLLLPESERAEYTSSDSSSLIKV